MTVRSNRSRKAVFAAEASSSGWRLTASNAPSDLPPSTLPSNASPAGSPRRLTGLVGYWPHALIGLSVVFTLVWNSVLVWLGLLFAGLV